jgi:hypothetical protein
MPRTLAHSRISAVFNPPADRCARCGPGFAHWLARAGPPPRTGPVPPAGPGHAWR